MHRCLAIILAAALLAALVVADIDPPAAAAQGDAEPAAPAEAEGWQALDISAEMNNDVVQTPNEWLRCWQVIHADVLRGDEDGDLSGHTIEGRHTVHDLFGQNLGGGGGYQVRGRYPRYRGSREDDVLWHEFTEPSQGLPRDGRVGRYRLHVDGFEHPEWARTGHGSPRRGRNAVRLVRPREDRTLRIELPKVQQRRYRAVNLLFAAEDAGNCVRVVAEYADGSEARLCQGAWADYHGRTRFSDDVPEPTDDGQPGQRQVVRLTPFANGWRVPYFRDRRYGYACMMEFDQPLRLDARKALAALRLETVYDGPDGIPVSNESWAVNVFAASAAPAE